MGKNFPRFRCFGLLAVIALIIMLLDSRYGYNLITAPILKPVAKDYHPQAKAPTQDQAQMPSITQVHTLCNELKDLAVSVMTYRQDNVPFEALIEAITNSPNQKAKVYAIAITTQAYKIPMSQSNDGKKSQTQKFASYVYNQCAQNPELLLRQG